MSQVPQMPVQEMTTPGFEPPMNTQFSVFLDNRVGKLRELVDVFEGQALTLAAISVVESVGHAVVRVLTSRAALARRLLQRANLPFAECDILVVELDPASGRTLPVLCETLLGAELAIHYAYPLMVCPHRLPVLALATDDRVLAGQLLRRKLFDLLGENDLGENATGSSPRHPLN